MQSILIFQLIEQISNHSLGVCAGILPSSYSWPFFIVTDLPCSKGCWVAREESGVEGTFMYNMRHSNVIWKCCCSKWHARTIVLDVTPCRLVNWLIIDVSKDRNFFTFRVKRPTKNDYCPLNISDTIRSFETSPFVSRYIATWTLRVGRWLLHSWVM